LERLRRRLRRRDVRMPRERALLGISERQPRGRLREYRERPHDK
jgi:hypothetical protein